MRFDVRKLTAALAVAGLAGAASPAMAQNTNIPSWVLTPYVSGFGVDGAYGVGGSDALKGIGGGISLGKTIADDFEVQLNVSHARRKDGANKVDQTLAGVDVSYFFNRTEWQPYFVLGAGAGRHPDRTRAAGLVLPWRRCRARRASRSGAGARCSERPSRWAWRWGWA